MRNDDWDAMHDDSASSASTGRVWMQRLVGIVLGGIAGAGAAYSLDLWHAVWNGGIKLSSERSLARPTERTAPIPAQDAAESARQIAYTLVTRARDLIARGEIRDAERFLAAAEKLEPDSVILAETRRLLDIAKAKIELARTSPATGRPAAPRYHLTAS